MEEDLNITDFLKIKDEYQLMEFIEEKYYSKNLKETESSIKNFQNYITKYLNKNNDTIIKKLFDQTENIMKMLQDLKITKEELLKSQNKIDSISNQILM